MAAIWGYIGKDTSPEATVVDKMRKSMEPFKVDRVSETSGEGVYVACGHQYFTSEAVNDKSPIYDEAARFYFVADCFLYNRKDLTDELKKVTNEAVSGISDTIGDAELAYIAYKCWGEEFVNHLRGSFSFVIYREETSEVLLFADHTANRYLAYCYNAGTVLFSTVYQPLLAALPKEKLKLCEKWIASAYMDCSADTIKLPRITVYENIFQVEPASYVVINMNDGKIQYRYYWNPVKDTKKIKNKTDDEMRELFISTMENVVNGMVRPRGNVGIELSGGLDSSTVAAFVARNLQNDGKNLFTYTSVPTPEYKYVNDRLTVENESEYIYEQQKMYPNISPRFLDGENKNSITDLERYVRIYSAPVKASLNMPYIDSMYKEAVKDECSLVFSGGNGNATISYGREMTFFYQKLVSLHFKTAFTEMNIFCKRFRLPKKKFLTIFFRTFLEEKVHNSEWKESCFIRKDLQKKYRLVPLLKSISRKRGTGSLDSVRQRRNFGYMPEVFQHMGFYSTYGSLHYGFLPLDPTLSKEVIELCINMPIEYFVRNGKERRAVRDYMKGYVCDAILDNFTARGSQGADYCFRFNRDWEVIREKVFSLLGNPGLNEYFDENRISDIINELKKMGDKDKDVTREYVAISSVIGSLSAFLLDFSKKTL